MIPPDLDPTPPLVTRVRLIVREHRHAARWRAGRRLRALADVLDPPRVLPEGVWRVRVPIPYTSGSAVPYLSDVPTPAASRGTVLGSLYGAGGLIPGGQMIVNATPPLSALDVETARGAGRVIGYREGLEDGRRGR